MSKPEVIQRLQTEFIPVSAGAEKLQWGTSESAAWFKQMATQTIKDSGLSDWWEKYQNYQGIYIAGPDGTGYGMILQWDPDETMRTLDRALKQYKARPPKQIIVSTESIKNAAPTTPDLSTSVVRLFSRCMPVPKGAHFLNESVGRDHMWIFADEVREIITATDGSSKSVPMPRNVVARMVRFQLLDNVRGLADCFGADEVSKADFHMRVVRDQDQVRTVAFTGEFAARKDFTGDENYTGEIGVEGKIEGEFDVGLAKAKLDRFRAYCEAKAWGANANTWHQPDGKFPLVIAMVEASDALSRMVPPMWYDISDPYFGFLTHEDYINPTLALDADPQGYEAS